MEAPARSQGAVCPACGRGLDPLRAGQVAILDGAFRYFCGGACKAAYLETSEKRPRLDAMTAEPPPVVESGIRTPVAFPAIEPPEAKSAERPAIPEEAPTL